jgi:peptidoglycan/LPS O-acetylase OafA/YrhL
VNKSSWQSVLTHGLRELFHAPIGTIPGLDALRSAAILLVISGHYYATFAQDTHQELAIGHFPVFYLGWTGVDLFFVLSGLLIGRQLWREMRDNSTIDVPAFLLRRGLRIWPYYFAFILWFVLFVTKHKWYEFWPDVLFVSNYTPGKISGGWSLSMEEQFYLLVPWLILIGCKFASLRLQWVWMAVWLAALPLVRAIVLARYGVHAHEGMSMYVTTSPFHTHTDGLLTGLLLAWASAVHPQAMSHKPLLRNAVLPVCLIVAGGVLRQLNPDWFAFSGLAAIYGGMTLFVLRDRSWVTRISRLRIFHLISRLSYAMYLNHFVVLDSVTPAILARLPASYAGFAVGYFLSILISAAAATVTFVLIESPALQWRDRWLESRRAKAPIVVAAA